MVTKINIALCLWIVAFAASIADAQTEVPSLVEVSEGKINVVFPVGAGTTPGKVYRIERSMDLDE